MYLSIVGDSSSPVVNVLVLKGRYQEIRVARAFFVSIRLNLSKEILLPKRERLVPHPFKLCKTCVAEHPAKGGLDVRTLVVFSFIDY